MRVLVHEVILTDDSSFDIISIVDSFRNSEQGQWLKEVSYKPIEWSIVPDARTLSSTNQHFAWLSEQNWTFYQLKWK